MDYLQRKKCDDIFSRLDTIHKRDSQTDGRTDIGRQQRPRLRIASRVNDALINKRCAWRYDMPPPLSSPRERPSASRAAEQTQRSSSFPRLIRPHGHRCTYLADTIYPLSTAVLYFTTSSTVRRHITINRSINTPLDDRRPCVCDGGSKRLELPAAIRQGCSFAGRLPP